MNRRGFLSTVLLAPFAKFLRPSIPPAKPLGLAFNRYAMPLSAVSAPFPNYGPWPPLEEKYFGVDVDFSEEELRRTIDDFQNWKLSHAE